MQEIWRAIPEFVGQYEASNLGRIRSLKRHNYIKILSSTLHHSGYLCVMLYPGKQSWKLVHILVANAFLGECPPGFEVDHKDGNRSNPVLGNLQYLSKPKNLQKGLRTKLLVWEIMEIRSLNIHFNQIELASLYKITQQHVSRILLGEIWRNVP